MSQDSLQKGLDKGNQGIISQKINAFLDLINLGPERNKSEEKTVHVDVKMIKLDWLFAKQGYSENGNDFL